MPRKRIIHYKKHNGVITRFYGEWDISDNFNDDWSPENHKGPWIVSKSHTGAIFAYPVSPIDDRDHSHYYLAALIRGFYPSDKVKVVAKLPNAPVDKSDPERVLGFICNAAHVLNNHINNMKTCGRFDLIKTKQPCV